MGPIPELDRDDPERELAFELYFRLSVPTEQLVEKMLRRSAELKGELIRLGHRRPLEVIRRECR